MSGLSTHPYAVERWTDGEASVLNRYFTNLDQPVFALINLPEVVKGALFARYSRTPKSLRRLFLDEFAEPAEVWEDPTSVPRPGGRSGPGPTMGVDRAEQLYQRVFSEYGDDSVAQLGGAHLACEQVSNVLTKVIERGRLMSYLEQSTRYIAYDDRVMGRYRYYRDPEILASPFGMRYVADVDSLFDTYRDLLPKMEAYFAQEFPRDPGDSEGVHRRAVRAKALDSLRGLLPAASLSNLGVFGSGQGYEAMLVRMRAHRLAEANSYSEMILTELRKVIPSFLTRVDRPDRGGVWSEYLRDVDSATAAVAAALFERATPDTADEVTLVHFDPSAEEVLFAAMLYPYVDVPEAQIATRVATMADEDRAQLVEAYVGERTNRRHKPGRALERVSYRFDVLSDYGAFRDLQRHRLLTIQWQALTAGHGYELPPEVADAGVGDPYHAAMARSAALYAVLEEQFGLRASYVVALGYRVRYSIEMNAREALHMLELRSAPAGHSSYRRVVQKMHHLIEHRAGHRHVAAMMRFVDHSNGGLERLGGERAAELRREAGESRGGS